MKTFNNKALIKIFIIYDLFTFVSICRKYFIYKRKLYIIIKFVKKYDYLCKHLYYIIIIYINHKSFTYFLRFNIYKEIYEHWVNQLRRFNIEIIYISNYKNKIIDVLFRTLFDAKCNKIL